MEILNIDTYEADIVIKDQYCTVYFDIRWKDQEGIVEISKIVNEADKNIFDELSYNDVAEIEDSIEKYGDKSAWIDDYEVDCCSFIARNGY
jgi:hypothetical protein